MVRHGACVGEECMVLIGHDGKRPLRRPRCQWEDNITVDIREIGWWGVDWIHLAQDRD
jgi:hypothetical protein